jgi:hypothetical protein
MKKYDQMKKIVYIFIIASFISFFWKCTEEPNWEGPSDNIPPGSISNPIVKNFPGSARIIYTLPSDDDLLGVKAVYSFTDDGEINEVFSSAFRDTIELYGFPDTSERTVKLICIDKSKNESEPVEVIVNPLPPPVELIRESMIVKETFGGVYVSWENIYEENIGISLYAADSTGTMVYNYSYYTNKIKGEYAFRGFDDKERKFKIEIHDNWDRYSMPLDTVLKPLYEAKIEPRDDDGNLLFIQYGADDGTDTWRGCVPYAEQVHGQAWHLAFDGDPGTFFSTRVGNMLSLYTGNSEDTKEVEPIYWILDLSRKCKISRHKMWFWPHFKPFGGVLPKYYELWATNDIPKGPDDFNDKMESLAYWTAWSEVGGTDAWKNDWTKIADIACLPPSGVTEASLVTEEDRQWAKNNGFDIEIEQDLATQEFRYIRFVVTEIWEYGYGIFTQVGDCDFWGNCCD